MIFDIDINDFIQYQTKQFEYRKKERTRTRTNSIKKINKYKRKNDN